jgi:hypothetical protein
MRQRPGIVGTIRLGDTALSVEGGRGEKGGSYETSSA